MRVFPYPAVLASLILPVLAPAAMAQSSQLGLPAKCTLGVDCFVQQYADMDPGPGAADPFCGIAAYEGHDGTDLRVLSMRDVERGVPVVAVADGTMLRGRDGEADRLVQTEADRAGVADKECGNGMILDHGGGLESQYCHLKQGSIVVSPGDKVKKGATIGLVGASGLAQFPHVHLTVRRDGKVIDPVTGHALDQGCIRPGDAATPLFEAAIVDRLDHGEAELIASGLAGAPIEHDALTVSGPPAAATAASGAFVAWGWFINLHQGDRVAIRLKDASGAILAEQMTEPMDHSKATYSAFAGKRGAPAPGRYEVASSVVRDGKTVLEKTLPVTID